MSEQSEKSENQSNDESVADDILRGAIPIGAELGIKPANIPYIVRTGKYPIAKLGKIYIASRRELRRAHRAMTRKSTPSP